VLQRLDAIRNTNPKLYEQIISECNSKYDESLIQTVVSYSYLSFIIGILLLIIGGVWAIVDVARGRRKKKEKVNI
jgi:hypothetical protein